LPYRQATYLCQELKYAPPYFFDQLDYRTNQDGNAKQIVETLNLAEPEYRDTTRVLTGESAAVIERIKKKSHPSSRSVNQKLLETISQNL